ncbi:MAG: phenylalanine--tRNA ligase subunit alpha [Saccharofermentanales bacterium]|jgi:phenylalanyl-tRNA synthetase alpha chain|nr:phenylalanine--tRNA ligase subunit alpha [Clostridiaceae bacterium]
MKVDLNQDLMQLQEEFLQAIDLAVSTQQVEELRIRYLGKKGKLTAILRGMGALSADERPLAGRLANQVRADLETQLTTARLRAEKKESAARLASEKLDITLPGRSTPVGCRHPLTQIIDEICDVFIGLGYSIAEGPEIELDKYNFELLRLPPGHPARDTQDTFYVSDAILLRTQTSPVQIRVMQQNQPPIKIVCPGKVYRSDTPDATHSPIFHQIEGLVVDQGVTMGDLVGSLQLFARKLFGEQTEIRLRPHHFPFTEPSCEVDISCWTCGGSGCRTCKNEGWIEVLGAGMVHPEVLTNCGIDPDVYSGFAFGIGVERTAMGRFGIDDIRNFFENDVRFLGQFR